MYIQHHLNIHTVDKQGISFKYMYVATVPFGKLECDPRRRSISIHELQSNYEFCRVFLHFIC